MNSFLQRSRTLSSKPSSWDLIFSYSRSACWLFLLGHREVLGAWPGSGRLVALGVCLVLGSACGPRAEAGAGEGVGTEAAGRVSPVAVDRHSNDDHHGHHDQRQDEAERHFTHTCVILHTAQHPLPGAELHLRGGEDSAQTGGAQTSSQHRLAHSGVLPSSCSLDPSPLPPLPCGPAPHAQ